MSEAVVIRPEGKPRKVSLMEAIQQVNLHTPPTARGYLRRRVSDLTEDQVDTRRVYYQESYARKVSTPEGRAKYNADKRAYYLYKKTTDPVWYERHKARSKLNNAQARAKVQARRELRSHGHKPG